MDVEQQGRLAQDALNNEAFTKAVERIKEKLTRSWIDADAKDHELREQAWASIRLLENIVWELEAMLNEGNQAAVDRKHQEMLEQSQREKEKRKEEYFNTPLKGTRVPDQKVEMSIT